MTVPAILAIDQGTTNTKVALYDATNGSVLGKASQELSVQHPAPGWAEQSAEAIWGSVAGAVAETLAATPGCDIAAMAVTNQRETIVLWDAETGRPLAPAISWQCRRTASICTGLARHADLIAERTGLGLDPLFPGTKLAWLLDNLPGARQRAEAGELRAGTIDSWLLWQLTGGECHATDYSNASRTLMFGIDTLDWDPEMLDLLGIPQSLLPQARPSDAMFGSTCATGIPVGVPIRAILGDSHAALLGHGFGRAGEAKVTCGTGSSLMAVTDRLVRSTHGLSSTIAWARDGQVFYALEGNVAVSGHAAAFGSKMLGLKDAEELGVLAATAESSEGVIFIPALAGLGAPHWNTDARGILLGMSLGTTPAHIARAVLDGVAQQICDIALAIDADFGAPLATLSVDGGAAANDLLMQMLANAIGRPVLRPAELGLSARGVAQLAAEAAGLCDGGWPHGAEARFEPMPLAEERETRRARWKAGVQAAIDFGAQP